MLHHIKHHILPTRHNRFIPKLLHETQIFVLLGLGIAFFGFAQYARLTDYFGLPATVYPATVYALTNRDRAENELPPVALNETLSKAAKLKADDMAKNGYFAHTSPEGRTPWYWFAQAGYDFIYAGENLAVNFEESEAVQDAWLQSPTHRANILNKNFTEMGVATATGMYNGRETTFVVEMFGMPATVRPPSTNPQTPADPVRPVRPSAQVAGETTTALKVLKETPTYTMVQNTDPTLEPGNPTPAATPKVSWMKRLMLQSDRIAGLVIQTIMILAIIATAGMVAREYEKHHKKHMVYGTLIAVIMFTALFVGKLGFFAPDLPLASAPLLEVSQLR